MKKAKLLLTLSLTAGILAFSGCQNTTPSASSADSETADVSFGSGTTSDDEIKSTVTIDQTYWAGSNIRVRMLFDDNGNCKYGYIGKYDLQTTEDGTTLLNFIYYADTDLDQMAVSSFALRDNGDGTYSKTVYTEDTEPAYDFDDENFTVTLQPDEGTDGLMSGTSFDGIYISSDGQYYTFSSDGTFAMETWMTYVADENHIELIGAESSTRYTYEANEDFSKLTLYKEGSKVMELATEEAIAAATAEEDSETSVESDASEN